MLAMRPTQTYKHANGTYERVGETCKNAKTYATIFLVLHLLCPVLAFCILTGSKNIVTAHLVSVAHRTDTLIA